MRDKSKSNRSPRRGDIGDDEPGKPSIEGFVPDKLYVIKGKWVVPPGGPTKKRPIIEVHPWLAELLANPAKLMEAVTGFVPVARQRKMLDYLNGRAGTGEVMRKALRIGSKQTFHGKDGRGGMNELLDWG